MKPHPTIEEKVVSQNSWNEAVEAHTQRLGTPPDYSQYPPVVIFRPVDQNYELRLIETGELRDSGEVIAGVIHNPNI
ncbi:hypothetical protein ACFP2F_11990 [Hymenobacter artigasi]|uniref:Uncharacterized protein n=1 Tax=Hymenobacter artigasi TaxID=2719616 RepID=A0ABX1HKH4_9BACT|nr:hypothetical protein [Hymenobacter artigasi]NKI89451.1 hypothetical protein [Hymenobacter artigasi]